jgi:hypothetical protein
MSGGVGATSSEKPRMTETHPLWGVCHLVELQDPNSLGVAPFLSQEQIQ